MANENDGRVLNAFGEMTDTMRESTLATADSQFHCWHNTSFDARADVVFKAATIMRERVNELAGLVPLKWGRLIGEVRGEIFLCADIIEYHAKCGKAVPAPERLRPSFESVDVDGLSIGVLLGVQPWNFPYYQMARFAAPNLIAGNAVVVKHVGCVPRCAIAFEQLWRDAGASVGAYTNLIISPHQVREAMSDSQLREVTRTGITALVKMDTVSNVA